MRSQNACGLAADDSHFCAHLVHKQDTKNDTDSYCSPCQNERLLEKGGLTRSFAFKGSDPLFKQPPAIHR
jgi:hypothetical protein